MRIIKEARLREYCSMYPDATNWLEPFIAVVKRTDWSSIQDVRRNYPHADAVEVKSGNIVTVFNVKGNRYRLVMALHYNTGLAYVLRFLPHSEYSKGRWKEVL